MFPGSELSPSVRVRIPRASGGVSMPSTWKSSSAQYSPRKRGCFFVEVALGGADRVFPAQAGVFPALKESGPRFEGIPRASGGVSEAAGVVGRSIEYSPRKRGCFLDDLFLGARFGVFPAQAGVFPGILSKLR